MTVEVTMLRIRKEQMDAFSQAAARSFEDRMVEHLTEFFPEQCEALGEPETREAIQHGINRAKTYGIISERDVCKYIDLMFTFGRDFDEDAELPWAGRILNDDEFVNASVKTDRLYDVAMRHVAQAAGIDHTEGI